MNSHGVEGKDRSYWLDTSPDTSYPPLTGGLKVDVAVIGGGFVGVCSAFYLKQAGFKVALIEGDRIVKGVTGNTTAKVTAQHGLVYKKVVKRFGKEKAEAYAESNQAAIEEIEALAEKHHIDCDFSRLPFYIYAQTDEGLKQIEAEAKSALRAGLPASMVDRIPLPVNIVGALRVERQAQFHPRKFVLSLASTIPGAGSFIFENTRVMDIDHGQTCTLHTRNGKLQANHVIVATNFPIFDKEGFYFARLQPRRSYALAVKAPGPLPKGMFLDAEKEYAWRSQPDQNGDLLIVSGANHVPGHPDETTQFYKDVEREAKQVFGESASVRHSWSTQDNVPYDVVPYIGRLELLHKNVYVATGFSQWGMTTSVVAGKVLLDLIKGRPGPWSDLYDPLRFKPDLASAKRLISQNASVLKEFVGERLTKAPDESELKPGEGSVVGDGVARSAVYKDESGRVVRLDARCTHVGCIVRWNNAEKSWDCPCHGSRFDASGKVIHAPAVKDMEHKQP